MMYLLLYSSDSNTLGYTCSFDGSSRLPFPDASISGVDVCTKMCFSSLTFRFLIAETNRGAHATVPVPCRLVQEQAHGS